MAKQPIAVNGCQLKPVSPATGTVTVTSVASSQVLINGKGVFFKEIAFTIASSNGGGAITDNNGVGSGKITASYDAITDTQNGVLRKGDKAENISITGTASGQPVTPAPKISVEITDAGQTDVNAL